MQNLATLVAQVATPEPELAPGFLGNVSYPGDNCCRFYWDRNFGGRAIHGCIEDGEDYYFSLCAPWDKDWNDEASSVVCGKNVRYRFYAGGRYEGQTDDVMTGAGYIKNPDLDDLDDEISHFWVGPYDSVKAGTATVFQNADCSGMSARLDWEYNGGAGGAYTWNDIDGLGMNGEDIKAIMVPYGYYVKGFVGEGLSSTDQYTYEGKYVNTQTREMVCQNVEFLNKSMSIHKKPNFIAQGSWKSVTTTESQTYKLHVGMKHGSAVKNTHTSEDTMSTAMSLGFEYGGIKGGVEIKNSHTDKLVRDVEETYASDFEETLTTTCTTEGKEGAGLYQWVVSTGDAETNISVFSRHYVCRTGANWATEPACPWSACVDAECNSCRDGW